MLGQRAGSQGLDKMRFIEWISEPSSTITKIAILIGYGAGMLTIEFCEVNGILFRGAIYLLSINLFIYLSFIFEKYNLGGKNRAKQDTHSS